MKKENPIERIIADLAQQAKADKLIADPDTAPGDKFVQFMDLVDLDTLYAELADTMSEDKQPTACQQVLMKLVEIYKPDLFNATDDAPEIEMVKIEAKSAKDLRDQLKALVDEGKLPYEAAREIFATIMSEKDAPPLIPKDLLDGLKKEFFDSPEYAKIKAEMAEMAKDMNIPDSVRDDVEEFLKKQLMGDKKDDNPKPSDIN